jgi:hypothetical protein
VEIYYLYIAYSIIVFPINIHFINKKLKTVKDEKNIYNIQIWTAYILMLPALAVLIFSLLFGILSAYL